MKSSCPRRKRMRKDARLNSARSTQWVDNYTGKNIVRGYCKWFGVDELCAVIELRILGAPLNATREAELRHMLVRKAEKSAEKKKLRQECEAREAYPDSDDTFEFIAGYTSGGAPYGVEWGEMDDSDDLFE